MLPVRPHLVERCMSLPAWWWYPLAAVLLSVSSLAWSQEQQRQPAPQHPSSVPTPDEISEAVSSALPALRARVHQALGGLSAQGGADVSLQEQRIEDELAVSHLFALEAAAWLKAEKGSYFGVFAPFVRTHADMSLEARDTVQWGLEQVYIGAKFDPQVAVSFGLRSEDFLGSSLMSYGRSLPTTAVEMGRGSWSGGLWVSSLPYEKRDRPVISREVPYSVALAVERSFDREHYFMLRRLSVRWLTSHNIPSELAEEYGERGNLVTRGLLATNMQHHMSTVGQRLDLGHRISETQEVEGSVEVMSNLAAPRERSMGLWAEVIYRKGFVWAGENSRWMLGGQLYSMGSDVFLAEFAHRDLGYTGVEGQGFMLGLQRASLEVEGRFRAYQPREKSFYKRKTQAFQFALKYRLW